MDYTQNMLDKCVENYVSPNMEECSGRCSFDSAKIRLSFTKSNLPLPGKSNRGIGNINFARRFLRLILPPKLVLGQASTKVGVWCRREATFFFSKVTVSRRREAMFHKWMSGLACGLVARPVALRPLLWPSRVLEK